MSLADPSSVEMALELLRQAKKPLVIIGKGEEKHMLWMTSE